MIEKTKEIFIAVGIFAVVCFVGTIIANHCTRDADVIDKTIQTNVYDIQAIQKKQDSLVIDINKLDSIKNAEIIKVQTVDADSVIELFYKLVRE